MVIPSLLPLKIPAIEIHCSNRDTLWNKLEINSHTKIEIAIKCKSKPMGIVNKWQTLQNKHTVNNKTEINSHAKIEIAMKCKSKPIGIVNKWQTLQNRHTVNNKPQINSHAKIEIAIECNYKLIQIVHALWLAIKPFYMSVCKHGFRSSFISYFIKEM